MASGSLGKSLGGIASRLALALGLAAAVSSASQAQQATSPIQIGTSFDCSRPGAGQSIPALVCQTPELQLADLHQMQAYYTLRHAQPQRLQELRNQFTARIQALVRECSTEQVRASGSQPICVAQALGNLRAFWLEQLQQTGNAAALEEARHPVGHLVGAQQALRTSGFLPANAVVDGVYGSGTRDAVARFQAERGIASNGFLTQATMTALRSASTAGTTTPGAPAAATPQQPPVSAPQSAQAQPAQRVQTPPSNLQQAAPRSEVVSAPIDRATQEQLASAQRALEAQDYSTALRIYRPLAEQGVAAAQGGMARLFANGWGVARDDAGALRWARLGTAQNDPTSQAALGLMLMQGRGVAQDDVEAVRWLRMAAAQGNAIAQNGLGFAFMNGRGVTRDDAEAIRWLRIAAAQGNASAQTNLGRMLREGRGVGRDDAEAVRWFRRAAEQGNADGQTNLGAMLGEGRGVGRDDAEAVRWFRLAANQGFARAQANLGWMYAEGLGVTRNTEEAVRWYQRAAAQGDTIARQNLDRLANTPPSLSPGVNPPPARRARGQGPAANLVQWDDGASEVFWNFANATMNSHLLAGLGAFGFTVRLSQALWIRQEIPIVERDILAGHSFDEIVYVGEENWDEDGCGYTQTIALRDSRIPRRINGTIIDGEKAGFSMRVRFRMAPQDVDDIRVNPFPWERIGNTQQLQFPPMFFATGGNQIISVERSTGILRNGQIVFEAYGKQAFPSVIFAPPGVSQAEMSRTLMSLRSACDRAVLSRVERVVPR